MVQLNIVINKLRRNPYRLKKQRPKATPKKRPVLSSSSSEDDERGETDPSKMVYDEDEAW